MATHPMKYLVYGLFSFGPLFNLYFFAFPPDRISPLSLSVGDRYYSHLNDWFFFARNNNWTDADKIEPSIDPIDIDFYKSIHHPDQIQQNIDRLLTKTDKTIEDWLELAKLQLRIGDKQLASQSLNQARQLDPIRDDINQFYLQLKK